MFDLVRRKRAEPTDDLLGGLAHPADPDAEIVSLGTLLPIVGHETTSNMIGLGTFALLNNPERYAALVRDPGLVGWRWRSCRATSRWSISASTGGRCATWS
ncbi:MAG TPA: hypothetical protein VLJ59_09145 [Mycobacteriales bacterium]|nr:hypothetical protein [Mycobacteriales bacterium]